MEAPTRRGRHVKMPMDAMTMETLHAQQNSYSAILPDDRQKKQCVVTKSNRQVRMCVCVREISQWRLLHLPVAATRAINKMTT